MPRSLFVPRHNLVLIGGRGAGKSALSRRIVRANKGFTPLCLDALIRYEAGGRDIPDIVEDRGWAGFRELEFEVVRKAAAFPSGMLLDCGGGVVTDLGSDGNETYSARKVEALRAHGVVFYLERDVDYLLERIRGDVDRPPLSATLSFRDIMARRAPWYRRAAHHVVACGRRSKADLVAEILDRFSTAPPLTSSGHGGFTQSR